MNRSHALPRSAASLLALAIPLQAQDPPAHRGSLDGIAGEISQGDAISSSRGPHILPDEWRNAARHTLTERLHLKFALSYDALAIGTLDQGTRGAASADTALSIRWQALPESSRCPLALAFRIRDRHAFTERPPSAIASGQNLLWRPVDGFNDNGFEIPELFLEQHLLQKRLLLRWGQMAADELLDDHPLRSAKQSFLNQAFSSSPATGFPGTGLGLAARWLFHQSADLTITASNVQSSNVSDDGRWLLRSESLFQGLQAGWNFHHGQRLQALAWRTDGLPGESSSADRGLSLTWSLTNPTSDTRWFARAAFADGGTASATHFAALGTSFNVRSRDRLGFAISLGRNTLSNTNWQSAAESFYRWQLTKDVQITAFSQLITGHHVAQNNGWLATAGLRLGCRF